MTERPPDTLARTNQALAAEAAAFPLVQAQAKRLYTAYVCGLGPLGEALPPWQDLIDRQQYAWRCVVRVQEETPLVQAPAQALYAAFPHLQAQAQRLYTASVTGLGPLGEALPPWGDLLNRQQYAWRCVVRAQEEPLCKETP